MRFGEPGAAGGAAIGATAGNAGTGAAIASLIPLGLKGTNSVPGHHIFIY